MRRIVAVAVLAVALTGCGDDEVGETPEFVAVQPESRDEGIQATGLLDGQRIAISRGNPTVILGDCDANDGLDEDLCILSRTIDGLQVNLVIENPAVLVPGETVEAGFDCGISCDDETRGAAVELRIDGERIGVDGGRIDVREAGPRYIADFDLDLPFGDRLQGSFDVRP